MVDLNPDTALQMLDRVGEGVLLVEPGGNVAFVNRTLARWSRIDPTEAIGRPLALLWDPEEPGVEALIAAIREAFRFGVSSLYSPGLHLGLLPLFDRRDGRLRQRVLVEPFPRGCLVRVQDASEVLEREARLAEQEQQLEAQRKALFQQEREMHRVAHFDAVTGLANRAQLRGFVERALRRPVGQAFGAVCHFDLDGWAAVNQQFGAEVGDHLLRRLGTRLCREVRPIDLVGRTGSDEFVVILDDVEPRAAEAMCQRLLETIRKPVTVDAEELSVSASAGVATYPRDGSDPEALFHRAELAQQAAKRDGCNRYCVFTPGMDTDHGDRLAMLAALQRAVEEDAFELHYQPQVRLADGAVIGMEALLRWKREDGSWVSPGTFVPLLEENGLIAQVGRQVAQRAVHQARVWRQAGHPIRVAVNVSVHQLNDSFVGFLRDAVKGAGLGPGAFEVELTESVLVRDVTACRDKLQALRDRGIQVAIDDFGTGYSSLAHLRRFPVDVLKIDRAFVQEVHDPEGQAIVRTIIGLGRVLDLDVLAEGVETAEQVAFLRREGCSAIQGYWLGRPMDPVACTEWLDRYPERAREIGLDPVPASNPIRPAEPAASPF
ncbi:MAG TPA: EAL domain-containing protein [Myxococcales bacterium LLY-WYZ-16_1]|nr:EAL domain-containing protein [Myxococcales bacterium LLY-WYZ-16_1]